jgi:hypothetical protein
VQTDLGISGAPSQANESRAAAGKHLGKLLDGKRLSPIADRFELSDERVIRFNRSLDRNIVGRSDLSTRRRSPLPRAGPGGVALPPFFEKDFLKKKKPKVFLFLRLFPFSQQMSVGLTDSLNS